MFHLFVDKIQADSRIEALSSSGSTENRTSKCLSALPSGYKPGVLESGLGPKSKLVDGGRVGGDRQRTGEVLLPSQGWPKCSRESSPPT